jgi:[glutamine synthetase] adenylyltransferase / [glutamine synthetase]-adenylyl-L-tyrosine phosphorylase
VFESAVGREQATSVIGGILRLPRDAKAVVRDAAKMRADMERHKPAKSGLDVKLGPGGLVDLEFAVHVLQLTTHDGLDPNLDIALEALAASNLIQRNVIDAQKLLTRMLMMMRLVAPGDIKPTAETWQLVAEACGAASWDALLAEHDAARQSIAALWNGIKKEV